MTFKKFLHIHYTIYRFAFYTKNTFNVNVFSTKNTLLFVKVMSFSFSSKKKSKKNLIFFTPLQFFVFHPRIYK